MKKLLSIIIALLAISDLSGQNLTITNGEKTKEFDVNSYFEFKLKTTTVNGLDGHYEFFGSISSISKDSLSVNLNSYHSHFSKNEQLFWNDLNTVKTPFEIAFSTGDIDIMKNFKSLKQKQRKDNRIVFGAIFFFSSIITGVNALLVPDKTSKKNLLLSGAVQMGASITLLSFGNTKQYKFKGSGVGNPWRLK